MTTTKANLFSDLYWAREVTGNDRLALEWWDGRVRLVELAPDGSAIADTLSPKLTRGEMATFIGAFLRGWLRGRSDLKCGKAA